jgi:ferredoxin
MIVVEESTIKVYIDDEKCEQCQSKACIKACSLYDRGVLRLKGGKPTVLMSAEEVKRTATECLACEYECWFRGLKAIRIEIPIPGLEEYRRSVGLAR